MTDAAATFYDVHSFNGRVLSLGDYRRVFRSTANGAVIGFAALAAVGLFVTTVTLTAAWIVNTSLASNSQIHAKAAMGPGALALVKVDPSMARNLSGAAQRSIALAAVPDVSFAAKWAGVTAVAPASALTLPPKRSPDMASRVPLPRPHPAKYEIARSPIAPPAAQVAVALVPPTSTGETRVTPEPAHNKSMALPGPDSRTAVYDIAAHTVYLPNGEKLEAHSGLYDKMDDPRYVNVRMRGPTPPNVYDLTLREELFHGVRAIRLNPVDDGKMFGRDGMLAHTYMLGPNGQSNGCVSFKDYQKFLQAFLKGEVDRLVVVPNGGTQLALAARARRGQGGHYAANDLSAPANVNAW